MILWMALPAPHCIINADRIISHAPEASLCAVAAYESAILDMLLAYRSSAELANSAGLSIALDTFHTFQCSATNNKTERCGRPIASELGSDVARPHSLQ